MKLVFIFFITFLLRLLQ